jgi:pentatricopeptide repeat protein
MEQAGMSPNVVTYNTLLNLYVKQEDGERALKLIDKMEQTGIRADVVTYNMLLNLYVKQENEENALRILAMMEQASIRVDVVTYNTLLNLYVKQEDGERALKLLDKMEQTGIRADVVTIRLLIDLFVAKKQIDKASAYFQTIKHMYPIKREKGKDKLDCHGHSHESACIMIDDYLKSKANVSSFIIVTGIGHHGDNEDFSMKEKVKAFLREFHPSLILQENQSNPGMLICQKQSSTF